MKNNKKILYSMAAIITTSAAILGFFSSRISDTGYSKETKIKTDKSLPIDTLTVSSVSHVTYDIWPNRSYILTDKDMFIADWHDGWINNTFGNNKYNNQDNPKFINSGDTILIQGDKYFKNLSKTKFKNSGKIK